MSETTNEAAPTKAKRPVCKTEAELRATPQPEGAKGYKVTGKGEVRYCWGRNPYDALQQGARDMGFKAQSLGKQASGEQLLNEVASLPPEELQAFIAKFSNMQVAGAGPTGNVGAKKK